MEITPRELRDTEIHSEMRGYSRDEVNELLERAAAAIEASNERVTQLQDRLTSAQSEATRTRETEDILHRTLLLAQRAADEAVAEATAKSRQMLDDAEMTSRRLIADSEADARRRGEAERRRLEQEIVELAGRRDTLLADVEALTRFEAEYRERMVRALETDLSALKTRASTAPAAKPEPSDVEIPSPAAAGVPAPSPARITPADAPAPPDAEPAARDTGAAPAAPATLAAPPAPSVRPPIELNGRNEPAGPATSEVDVRTLFEQGHESGAGAVREQAPRDTPGDEPGPDEARREPGAGASGTAQAAGLQPIDLGGAEPVDANVLDDDAFFATLREAVHDEKPLGPRDEDDENSAENQFFDQDADRGSFRDVFRRRR